MTGYIRHVTLMTGHVVRQHRADMDDAAIAALSETLDGVLQGATMPVPGCPGYVVNGGHSGYDLWITVWREPWPSTTPIMTMGTALKSRSARGLWHMLHDTATTPCATDREAVPGAPWQADRIELGAIQHADAMSWTGDFSRCLAWTWHDYRRGR